MREKLRSQRETVISLTKPWDSRHNRETWQVWQHIYTFTWIWILSCCNPKKFESVFYKIKSICITLTNSNWETR